MFPFDDVIMVSTPADTIEIRTTVSTEIQFHQRKLFNLKRMPKDFLCSEMPHQKQLFFVVNLDKQFSEKIIG